MFFANMCFHLARKSFSAVKVSHYQLPHHVIAYDILQGVLKPNCSANYSTSGWEPFSKFLTDGHQLEGLAVVRAQCVGPIVRVCHLCSQIWTSGRCSSGWGTIL